MPRSSKSPPYLALDVVEAFVPLMRERGVSKVARSPRGFLAAYRRADGRMTNLPDEWRAERDGFVARHMAQLDRNGEALFEEGGRWAGLPTRRHLALIAWAYSPEVRKLRRLMG